MRELTDKEDRQFRERYPHVWTRITGRPMLVGADPISLQMYVFDEAAGHHLPVTVTGFKLDLEENQMANSRIGAPEILDQKRPSPTQGKLEPLPKKDVPYKSAKATPNSKVK